MAGTQELGPAVVACPGTLAGRQIRSGVARIQTHALAGHQCCRCRFNQPHHSNGPCFIHLKFPNPSQHIHINGQEHQKELRAKAMILETAQRLFTVPAAQARPSFSCVGTAHGALDMYSTYTASCFKSGVLQCGSIFV